MFCLTEEELENAFSAINHHGYSTMLPPPVEWASVKENWDQVRAYISRLDLDIYTPYKPMIVFAPKNRVNIRVVHLLHPEDLIIYTALVLIVKNDIENSRLSKKTKRVFSYRVKKSRNNVLYESKNSHNSYVSELESKAQKRKSKFVAVADIADFFPSIYQHRLENALTAIATTQRGEDVSRVLVRKLISNLMSRNSYGIPVGPYASRVLAEALLIDVDAYLYSNNINFVRWVDDYSIFCKTEYEAQSTVFSLGEWLYEHHGLILQSAKTKILTIEKYQSEMLARPGEDATNRDEVIELLRNFAFNPYEDDEDQEGEEFDEEHVQKAFEQLQLVDLVGMLEESVSDTTLVDYEIVNYVLTRLPKLPDPVGDMKKRVLDVVIDNAKLLYPLSEQIAKYVLSFEDLPKKDKKKMAKKLLRPLKSKHTPPDYYAMWMLYIFSVSEDWNQITDIVHLYQKTSSEVVRRYAALAIAKGGSRAETLVLKNDIATASDLLRLAILEASKKLGKDERKHWKLANQINGITEKVI